MKSIGLIQAIVLIDEKTQLKKSVYREEKIHAIEATPENLALAQELYQQVCHSHRGQSSGEKMKNGCIFASHVKIPNPRDKCE
jgi:hypothetical protein